MVIDTELSSNRNASEFKNSFFFYIIQNVKSMVSDTKQVDIHNNITLNHTFVPLSTNFSINGTDHKLVN